MDSSAISVPNDNESKKLAITTKRTKVSLDEENFQEVRSALQELAESLHKRLKVIHVSLHQ